MEFIHVVDDGDKLRIFLNMVLNLYIPQNRWTFSDKAGDYWLPMNESPAQNLLYEHEDSEPIIMKAAISF